LGFTYRTARKGMGNGHRTGIGGGVGEGNRIISGRGREKNQIKPRPREKGWGLKHDKEAV